MKNLTKLAIRKKLLEKLEEQPLSKISVRTICDELGINHNTFYYYYADIYAVIQEYFDENLESVEAVYSRTDSWELSFLEAVRPVMKNRRAVYHIYYSIRKEDLEQYLYSVSGNIMQAFVDSILPEVPAKEEDRKLIAKEMDSGFFSKVGDKKATDPLTDDTLEKLKLLISQLWTVMEMLQISLKKIQNLKSS